MTQNTFTHLLAKRSYLLFIAALAAMLALGVGPMPVAQAATFSVNSTADAVDANPGDGVCDDGSGNCTLRAAIQEANALAGADTINLPAGIYTLTLGSELPIDEDLTLTGAGVDSTIIQAATEPGVSNFRVFNITGGRLSLNNLTVRNGNVIGGGGGGILNFLSTVELTSTNVSNNQSEHMGGGIQNLFGTLTITNSNISNNRAGGIFNSNGSTLTITNSTISNNDGFRGGGISQEGGSVTLTNSTISNNECVPFILRDHGDSGGCRRQVGQ